jgi:hypothetical protein
MELKSTSKTGFLAELLNKTYSYDFWKGDLKPQIAGRIFAPMDCMGGKPERVEPSKGYIGFRSEDTFFYAGEEKNGKKAELEIPVERMTGVSIKDSLGNFLVGYILLGGIGAAAFGGDKKFLVLEYMDAFGGAQSRIFSFNDSSAAEQLVNLLNYVKAKAPALPPNATTPGTRVSSETRKFCRYCGAENKTDADFCEKCGKNIG